MSTGRHRTLDEVKCGQICTLVTIGCSLRAAAQFVGCDRGTIRREALRNDQFGQNLRRAELEAQLNPIRTMQQAATTHWRAAAWLLERTQPEQFARNAAQLVKMETVQDLVARCLAVIAEELSDTPENQAACRRLTHAIENTCGRLAVAANASRDPKRLRKVIAGMNTRPDPQAESPALAEPDMLQNSLA